MKGNRLYKYEKLCSRTSINEIFAQHGNSLTAYPLRVVYTVKPQAESPAQFLITIPKKKLRKAVERVLMRRRIREAYRLNRELLLPTLRSHGMSVDMAFIYMSPQLSHYSSIDRRIKELLTGLAAVVAKTAITETDESK